MALRMQLLPAPFVSVPVMKLMYMYVKIQPTGHCKDLNLVSPNQNHILFQLENMFLLQSNTW
jgi:hypothetical protein